MKKAFLLGAILFGAALLRAGYLLAPHIDSDQAIFGLQGWHILKGEFPVFSWGYSYMGTLQSYLDAVFFFLFGMSREVLNGVPLFLSLFFIVVTYFLVKELLGEKAGWVAAALSAFGPYYLVLHGAWARHGYMETLIFGSLLLLFTAKLLDPATPEEKRKSLFLWFGFVAGAAWWTNFLILTYLLPCGLFLWWRDKKLPLKKEFYWMLLAFFIGSSPFWIYNFAHSFASFSIFAHKGKLHLGNNTLLFLWPKLPGILGIRERSGLLWKIGGAVLYLFTALWLLSRKQPRTLLLPTVFVGFVFFLEVTSRFGGEKTERYLLPLYSVLPIFLAQVVVSLWQKRRASAGIFFAAVLMLDFYDNSLSLPWLNPTRIQDWRQDHACKERMLQTLHQKKIEGAYCLEYWVGPLLTFDAQEKVIFPKPFEDRYSLYTRKVDAMVNPAFLTVGGWGEWEEAMKNLQVRFEKFNAAPFDFYHAFQREAVAAEEIPAQGWKLTASDNAAQAAWAADRNNRSIWVASDTQKKGMTFTIELPHEEELCRIEGYLGRATKGAPQELAVELSSDGKNWKQVNPRPVRWGFFWSGTHPFCHASCGRMELSFPPQKAKWVRLRLTKTNPDSLYWALNEVMLYRAAKNPDAKPMPKQIAELAEVLYQFRQHRIYADTWLSAHLRENFPELNVADTWISFVDKKSRKAHQVKFFKPVLFIATAENQLALSQTLKEAHIEAKIIESGPFVLFIVPEKANGEKWIWIGKQLLRNPKKQDAS